MITVRCCGLRFCIRQGWAPQLRELKEQAKMSVERLNLPEGGRMVFADERSTNALLANIEAPCEAGEEYCLASLPD